MTTYLSILWFSFTQGCPWTKCRFDPRTFLTIHMRSVVEIHRVKATLAQCGVLLQNLGLPVNLTEQIDKFSQLLMMILRGQEASQSDEVSAIV